MPARERLRLALVGCGAISAWHAEALARVPEIEVAACVDADLSRAQALAKRAGGAACGSLDEALARGGFDAVDLMLPHDLHESAASQCLEAGLHVLLEKPLATTREACARLLALAAESPGVFMVGENAHYRPQVQTVKRLLDAGAIGEVQLCQVQKLWCADADFYGGAAHWRRSRARSGGGIVLDSGVHEIRPLRLWLGPVREVAAATARPQPEHEGESLAALLLRFERGAVASFNLWLGSRAALGPQQRFRLTGSEGEIAVVHAGSEVGVALYDRAHPDGAPVPELGPCDYLESFARGFRDFAAAALLGRPLAAGPEESLRDCEVAWAMERAARSGRFERVGA